MQGTAESSPGTSPTGMEEFARQCSKTKEKVLAELGPDLGKVFWHYIVNRGCQAPEVQEGLRHNLAVEMAKCLGGTEEGEIKFCKCLLFMGEIDNISMAGVRHDLIVHRDFSPHPVILR